MPIKRKEPFKCTDRNRCYPQTLMHVYNVRVEDSYSRDSAKRTKYNEQELNRNARTDKKFEQEKIVLCPPS
jgi:hypothetical protein